MNPRTIDAAIPAELHYRAMGTDVHVVVVGGRLGLVEQARRRIDDLETKWSRFLIDSEVNEMTRRAGSAVTVSDDTVLLVRRAIEGFDLSGGSFDPTVLGDLLRAGYNRPFEQLGHPAGTNADPRTSALMQGCADIEIDDRQVCLPVGTGFDPGGIGKGLAADLVSGELMEAGAGGACVNLGGDVRVRGAGPTGDEWTVAVVHPWSSDSVVTVGLHDGAVGTSTTLRRMWFGDGGLRHHLIDPGTGEPSTTDLNLASVIAAEGWMAEVLAKSVLLRGSHHPFDLLGDSGAEALAVDSNGRVLTSDGYGRFAGDCPPVSFITDLASVWSRP
jgi:thiamine biosynthesis lipoprotein